MFNVLKVVRWTLGLTAAAYTFAVFPAVCSATTPPQLWTRFSEPTNIVNINLVGAGQNPYDTLTLTTLQGAYNQLQGTTRLYVSMWNDDPYWLTHSVPSGITVTSLGTFSSADPDGALKAALSTYGSAIKGYILCDPEDEPESCDFAITLAGIRDGIVVNANNVSLMSTYGIPLIADLTTYNWITNNNSLVNDTTYNMINNPSGSDGTTGWTASSGTLTTGTGTANCSGQGSTLEWTRSSGNGDAWAWFGPVIPSDRINTTPYIFSVQVCVSSGSPVFLDAYNGVDDVRTAMTVSLGSGWQTLQLAVPIPISGAPSSNQTIKLQVRTSGSSTTVFFQNAAVIDNRVAIDMWQLINHSSDTNESMLGQNTTLNYALQPNFADYEVAAKLFTFSLTSINKSDPCTPNHPLYPDERALYQQILAKTSSVTPIMGYIDTECVDVPYLSGTSGHFLNATNTYNNGSVWASMPEPIALSQAAPTALQTSSGTIYLDLFNSDGDNVSYMQHRLQEGWTQAQFLGAVPTGWEVAPGSMYFSPGLISNFYQLLPQSQEIMAGPSGVGYATAITGGDLTDFTTYTNEFMSAESMNSVMSWEDLSDFNTFATGLTALHAISNQSGVSWSGTTKPIKGTQAFGYQTTPEDEINAVNSWISSNYTSGAPNFVEVLNNGWAFAPDTTLYIAQQLQAGTSHPIVFMTPSELAQTEWVKYNGGTKVTSNPQAVSGSTLLSAFPQNQLQNANGQERFTGIEGDWGLGTTGHYESLVHSDYLGSNCQILHVNANAGTTVWAYSSLTATANHWYRFTATVAGNGTAQLVVYDGSANNVSANITLTPNWQTITMMLQIKNASTGQIQIRLLNSSSAQSVYFTTGAGYLPGWNYSAVGSSSAGIVSAGATTYQNQQAMQFTVPANQSIDQWFANITSGLSIGQTYLASVDLAGTGQAFLDFYNGSTDLKSSTITLNSNYQTLTVSGAISGSNPPVFQLRVPNQSTDTTVYFRNASLIKSGSGGTGDFCAGLESGQTQLTCPAGGQTTLTWTNSLDNASPGGGDSDVIGELTQPSSTLSHGGTYAIQYGGTASGGPSTHAYLEAFSNSTTLTSTSRLSYWVFPVTPLGAESGASTMTGLNSTCIALDMIFTNGAALRNYTTVTDQYGNQMNPAHMCNHLQPDQWNYVTVNLGSLSGMSVARLDVGYDQPGATGNYGGYIDDITLIH